MLPYQFTWKRNMESWFANQIAPDGNIKDGCHPYEAEALKKYLGLKMKAEDAARAITKPVANDSEPGKVVHRLYSLLMDALIQLPSKYIRPLIILLKAINNLPEIDADVKGGKLWRGLPQFGWQWGDHYQIVDWRYDVPEPNTEERLELTRYHQKKAKIEAQMAMEGLADFSMDDGYEVIADALECSDALLDVEVFAAEEWLHIAKQRIVKGAADRERSWDLDNDEAITKRDLWTGSKCMSNERFDFWCYRLREIKKEIK